MMGDLHIEMDLMKCLGDWLEVSGWTALLSLAEITTSGKADSMLSGCSNIILCRYLHQVTASDLHIKKKEAYCEYIEECTDQMPLHEKEWELSKEAHPMFKFCNLTLHLELLLLEYVKSIRSGDFYLYVKTILSVVPWMFSLDHHHYARWLPVHIRAILNLPNAQPQIYSSFEDGKFTKFSRMALDQNHEQQNARIKGTGGAIGLTENDTSLRRWLASGPEVALILDEFAFCNEGEDDVTSEHHDSAVALQAQFLKDVNSHLPMIVLIFMLSTQKMYREKVLLNPLPLLGTLEHNNLEHIMIKDYKNARMLLPKLFTEIIYPYSALKQDLRRNQIRKRESKKSERGCCAVFPIIYIMPSKRKMILMTSFPMKIKLHHPSYPSWANSDQQKSNLIYFVAYYQYLL